MVRIFCTEVPKNNASKKELACNNIAPKASSDPPVLAMGATLCMTAQVATGAI
ncbi:MAG TPA: hypothetical protein VEA59_06660 [Patescibacteria group bacterium]|nr:hypothetical protein [Patescibacteria group bacterium]